MAGPADSPTLSTSTAAGWRWRTPGRSEGREPWRRRRVRTTGGGWPGRDDGGVTETGGSPSRYKNERFRSRFYGRFSCGISGRRLGIGIMKDCFGSEAEEAEAGYIQQTRRRMRWSGGRRGRAEEKELCRRPVTPPKDEPPSLTTLQRPSYRSRYGDRRRLSGRLHVAGLW